MDKPNGTTAKGVPTPADVMGYCVGAWQRSILFLDVMRQRAEQDEAHEKADLPHVLYFAAEVILDGRTPERPVNYVLARIPPKAGKAPHPAMRPFVVVDPRAGHGPGIGGFKADSEIGAAMAAGHPCYFVGFLPDPVPGQTVEDVARAEAVLLETVIARDPEADGQPCVVANCQAGWQMMMTNALRPEVFGPIIVAGSPLSYWAGVRGVLVETPLRGDAAPLACHRADYAGNLAYTLTAHNFNPIMALAADTVIAEAEHIVPVGMIPPDAVKTPGVVVDYLLERAA